MSPLTVSKYVNVFYSCFGTTGASTALACSTEAARSLANGCLGATVAVRKVAACVVLAAPGLNCMPAALPFRICVIKLSFSFCLLLIAGGGTGFTALNCQPGTVPFFNCVLNR